MATPIKSIKQTKAQEKIAQLIAAGRFKLLTQIMQIARQFYIEGAYNVAAWAKAGFVICTNGHMATRIKVGNLGNGTLNPKKFFAAKAAKLVMGDDGEFTMSAPLFQVEEFKDTDKAPDVEPLFPMAVRLSKLETTRFAAVDPNYLLQVAQMAIAAKWKAVGIYLPEQPDDKTKSLPVLFEQRGMYQPGTDVRLSWESLGNEQPSVEPDAAVIMPTNI